MDQAGPRHSILYEKHRFRRIGICPGICRTFDRRFESDARSRFEAGFTGASPGLPEVAHANSLKPLPLPLQLHYYYYYYYYYPFFYFIGYSLAFYFIFKI